MCQNSKQQMNYRTGSRRESYQDGTVDVYINDLTLGDNLMVHNPVNVEEKKHGFTLPTFGFDFVDF